MPYLNCPNCRLSVYSAAMYASVDHCPRCEARLGQARRLFMSPVPERLMPRSQSPSASRFTDTRFAADT
jgi:Zn-finger nucleic acid-binding protein